VAATIINQRRFQLRIAYSISEASEATSLGRSTIEDAVSTGRLPARKFGARTLKLAGDLQAFLESLPSPKRSAVP